MNPLQRPALGQIAQVGTLYDARNDAFLPLSLFTKKLRPEAISLDPQQKDVRLNFADSHKERFAMMGIEPELGASILTGLVKPRGSGTYLDRIQQTNQMLQATIQHKITVAQEKLEFGNSQARDCVDSMALRDPGATHVVIGINWGAQTIFNIRHWLSSAEAPEINHDFRAEMEKLSTGLSETSRRNHVSPKSFEQERLSLEIMAYSDSLDQGRIVMQDLQEVSRFIELVPLQISQESNAKGWPMSYTLFPIGTLSLIFGFHANIEKPWVPTDPVHLYNCVDLFDELQSYQNLLQFYLSSISKQKRYLAEDHIQEVENCARDVAKSQEKLKKQYAKLLLEIRRGETSPLSLQELQRQVLVDNASTERIAAAADMQLEKLDFISTAVAKGVTYVGYNGVNLNSIISRKTEKDIYVLFFNSAAIQDRESWDANKNLLLELLKQGEAVDSIAIADCDAATRNLSKAQICRYQKGRETVKDIVAHQVFLATECLAKFAEDSLEVKNVLKPLDRRPLKIACPGSNCNPEMVCDWKCSRCFEPLEYGYTDQYVYCGCGRSQCSNFEFKCNNDRHGIHYNTYDQGKLLSTLKDLAEPNCLNILILGETGVGKSTFINAFVNYLSFESLDDAKAEDLNWVVPCSFSMQTLDRSGSAREIEKFDIKVGQSDSEHDGSKGTSATQQTTVYPVTVGSYTVRLIDTPGIGDTRGTSHDKKNMADLLSTLSGYENLHGILILLKSNNSRLTITFNFCMKELLTHLHRSAAVNMAFGFTNTRISNYTPGDTFGPLSALLADHSDIGLSLTSKTAYCFDSESFRYLAALKNNVRMDNEDDFRRSWKHSRDEALRLLEHFKTMPAHPVKSTVSLNGTRQLVLELTKPMAEISQIIRTNIAMCEDRMQELKDTRLSGESLRKRLHLDKVQLKSQKLAKPRTVCTDISCVDYRDDGKGENKVVTVYKTHCHPECYLTDVKADEIAHPGLIHCAAFTGSTCTVCEHQWQKHLHVLYELEEYMATVMDTEVEQQLAMNANDVMLRQTAVRELNERLKEYRSEHGQIQEAAAKFGLFLKKYSITPYNDATLAYLDVLIRDEEEKTQAGGNDVRLHALQEDRTRHIELVEVLTKNMGNDSDLQDLNEKHVEQLVTDLYGLKHFGENLKTVKTTISSAHQATYREKPYRIQHKNSARWSAFDWFGYSDMSTPQGAPEHVNRKRGENQHTTIPNAEDSRKQSYSGKLGTSHLMPFKLLMRKASLG
jgi:GTPase SAR1 family protein